MAAAAVGAVGLTITIPLVTKAIIDGPITNRDIGALLPLGLLALALGVLEAFLIWVRRWVQSNAVLGLETEIRHDLYARLQQLPMSFHTRWESGQLLSRATQDLSAIRRFAGFGLLFLVLNILQVTVVTGVLLHLYWPLGLVVAAAAAPVPASDNNVRELLKRAYVTLDKMQTRIEDLRHGNREPVAIIGMACRFPGSCNDLDRFWDLLESGRSGVSRIPAERWNVDEYYDADSDTPGKMYVQCGGFLDGVTDFDAKFFGITAREAIALDPQQRLLLELSWEALEHAGICPDRQASVRGGVYVGISTDDYTRFDGDAEDIDPYAISGNSFSVAAGRTVLLPRLDGPKPRARHGVLVFAFGYSPGLPKRPHGRMRHRARGRRERDALTALGAGDVQRWSALPFGKLPYV